MVEKKKYFLLQCYREFDKEKFPKHEYTRGRFMSMYGKTNTVL